MNQEMMERVAEELISLKREYGDKIFIPRSRVEGLQFIKKQSYGLKSTFAPDDPKILDELRQLARKHHLIVVLHNFPENYQIYVSSFDDKSVKAEKASGCYIATAAYGSPLAPEVIFFRRFRDEVLLTSSLGSIFVEVYYFVSPALASLISRADILKRATRHLVLMPILRLLKSRNKH